MSDTPYRLSVGDWLAYLRKRLPHRWRCAGTWNSYGWCSRCDVLRRMPRYAVTERGLVALPVPPPTATTRPGPPEDFDG